MQHLEFTCAIDIGITSCVLKNTRGRGCLLLECAFLQVSQLAGFWMLTILQLPLTIYMLANVSTIILPLERAINILFLAFIVVETITGFYALHVLIKAQVLKFHLATRFDSIVQSDEANTKLLT